MFAGLVAKNLPWGKIIIGAVGLAMVIAVLILRSQLSNAREEIAGLKEDRVVIAKELGTKPNHVLILQKIKAVKQESANRKAALDQINAETLALKARERELDLALKNAQRENLKKFAEAQKTIAELRKRKPGSGNADEDSKAPWSGWKFQQKIQSDRLYVDSHRWAGAQFVQLKRTILLVPYATRADIVKSWNKMYPNDPANPDFTLYGFAHSKGSVCEIHMLDPQVSYEPEILGHEFAHCLYGHWHAERR